MDIYTGFLKYKDMDFSFVFSNNELKLVAPPEKAEWIRLNWLMKPTGNGVYTVGNTIYVEEPAIIGSCNETGSSIIFIPIVGSTIYGTNKLFGKGLPILIIKLEAYITCKYERELISRLSFTGPEINRIHPVNQAITWEYNPENLEDGIYKIETRGFSITTTEEKEFTVNGKKVTSKFGITRGISTRINESPVSLNSTLMFEFEPTKDFEFIFRLCKIARDYIRFLCYRKNIVFEDINVSAPYPDGKFEPFGTLHLIEEQTAENKPLNDNRVIKQIFINKCESRILQDISDNVLYLRHIPESYKSGRHIDAARFIMITAAFEWEFRRMSPDGIIKSKKRKQAEERAIASIQDLINTHSGKEKKIYKFLKSLIDSASLQDEVEAASKLLDPIIGVFGKHLYSINNEELKYSDMGKRLSDQRNHFAHGDLDKDFIGTSLLDLIFLEQIIYAMQLKYYGLDELSIRKAINELFHLNYAI